MPQAIHKMVGCICGITTCGRKPAKLDRKNHQQDKSNQKLRHCLTQYGEEPADVVNYAFCLIAETIPIVIPRIAARSSDTDDSSSVAGRKFWMILEIDEPETIEVPKFP